MGAMKSWKKPELKIYHATVPFNNLKTIPIKLKAESGAQKMLVGRYITTTYYAEEEWPPIVVVRVNERRYEFGEENGATHWVCSKVPNNGIVKKDCVPKVSDHHLLYCLVRKYGFAQTHWPYL